MAQPRSQGLAPHRPLVAIAVAVALAAALTLPSPTRAASPAPARAATVVADHRLSDRLHELDIDAPSVGGLTHARVLLPASYDRDARRRYPVLYVLHGANSDYRAWTERVDVASVTAAYDVIVVMPDGGAAGFYSDWYNDGAGGPPAWETYHVHELRRLLDQRYRTNGRYAAAGQSMGGFGALSYASRHPDLFPVVAAFSGAVDTRLGEPVTPLALSLLTGVTDGAPSGTWGDFLRDEVRWRAHNPLDLAPNLRNSAVFLSSGNGAPGPLDAPTDPNVAWMAPLEAAIYAMNVEYSARLDDLGIAAVRDLDRAGTHNLAYGLRALATWLPDILAALAESPTGLSDFSHRSAEREFAAWGWSFSTTNERPTFTDVRVSGPTISATGNGPLGVVTPPTYRPHGRYLVIGAAGADPIRADGEGRLRFTMELGETAERYTPLPDRPGPRPRGPAVAVSIVER